MVAAAMLKMLPILLLGLLALPSAAVPLRMKQRTGEEKCGKRDIMILLHASSNMDVQQWDQAKTFIKDISAVFDDGARVAVGVYSVDATVAVPFESTESLTELQRLVDGIIYIKGELHMDKALNLGAHILEPEPSTVVNTENARIALILTDMHNKGPQALNVSVGQLTAHGIETVVVGVGKGVDESDLHGKGGGFLLLEPSYESLVANAKELAAEVCKLPPLKQTDFTALPDLDAAEPVTAPAPASPEPKRDEDKPAAAAPAPAANGDLEALRKLVDKQQEDIAELRDQLANNAAAAATATAAATAAAAPPPPACDALTTCGECTAASCSWSFKGEAWACTTSPCPEGSGACVTVAAACPASASVSTPPAAPVDVTPPVAPEAPLPQQAALTKGQEKGFFQQQAPVVQQQQTQQQQQQFQACAEPPCPNGVTIDIKQLDTASGEISPLTIGA